MPTHAELIDAAHALVPTIRAAARSAELARQPDDAVIAQARDAGLFTMLSPRAYGGSELDLDTFFEVGLILGEADASHGWVLNFYVEHVWMFTQFPESFQKEVFSDRSFVMAPAMLSPAGKAKPVDGGFELSGRWQWGTGIVHADWVIAGAILNAADGPEAVFFALPRDQVRVEDTWQVDGMCATGSHDVLIDRVFVPADRMVSIRQMLNADAPGSRVHDGPIYSTPMAPLLSFAAALPALGQARSCVKEYASQLHSRYDLARIEAQSNKTGRQSRVAEADLDIAAAEALARWVVADVMRQRGNADEATRVRWTSSIAHVVHTSQRAVDMLCEAAGASSHFLDNPLQRARRDLHTMACHTVFDPDERRRCHGRSLLGLPSQSAWH
jgi:3-hydroxy-9,10-secoandrosta-1,3,5(10)-triene-9,17-dione monooxygenase